MKTLPLLFSPFIFVGLFNGILSSNPDSIQVLGPEDNEEKSAQVHTEERQQREPKNADRGGENVISFAGRVPFDSRMDYSEISKEDFERLMECRGFPREWHAFSINQPNLRGQPENPNGNGARYFVISRRQQNRVRGNSNRCEQEILKAFGVPAVTPESEDSNSGMSIGANGFQGTRNNANRGNNNNANEGSKTFSIPSDASKTTPSIGANGFQGTRNNANRGNNNNANEGSKTFSIPSDASKTRPSIGANGFQGTRNNSNRGNNNNANEGSETFTISSDASKTEDTNRQGPLVDHGRQIPPNNAKGNNNYNNPRRTVNPVDLVPTVPEEEEEIFQDDIPRNPTTNAVKRVSQNLNFFAGIVNDFAFKLVETLNLQRNFVISPMSIYIALAMCYLGSDGRTKQQLEQALGINENDVHDERLHQGLEELISSVRAETPGYQLFLANGMLLGKNFTVRSQFDNYIRKYYDAEVMNLDFSNPELSLHFVNKWVVENTRNMITSILNSPPPVATRLFLLNAIFFKGIWEIQFPIHLTKKGKFYTANGTENEVDFMNVYDESFPFYRSDEYRHHFIKLSYENNEVSMIIAKPFTAREKPLPRMRDRDLCTVRNSMVTTKFGRVSIPKFRLEDRNYLKKPLQNLGVTDIFNSNEVNLRYLRDKNDVYASTIIHKAVIDIDEVGTTTYDSTDVVYELFIRTPNFEANHPFSLYVIHEPTGLVLFYGKIFNFESDVNIEDDIRQNVPARPRPNLQNLG